MSPTILLQPASATPTLRRLNSREMMRSLPHDEDALAAAEKAKKNACELSVHEEVDNEHHDWLAPPLAPKVMEPMRHSKASDASLQLQRIEYIEIADVVKHEDDHKNYYVVNVYLKHEQSRIPTNQATHNRQVLHPHLHGQRGHAAADDVPPGPPDYTVHRRFSDFDKLRQDLWEALQHPHRHYCSFCDGFMFLLLFSSAQPGMVAKTFLRSTDIRSKLLDKFLHKLLSEYQANRPRCRFACYSVEHLPILLHDFLFGTNFQVEMANHHHHHHHHATDEEEELDVNPAASPMSTASR